MEGEGRWRGEEGKEEVVVVVVTVVVLVSVVEDMVMMICSLSYDFYKHLR